MGIVRSMERDSRSMPLSDPRVADFLGLSQPAPSGVRITERKALGITAFWAGVRQISQTIAQMPIDVYEHTGPGERRVAEEHPVHRLMSFHPNPRMTPFEFKEVRSAHVLTWGNSYAEIERNAAGHVVALWPLLPDRTWPEIRNGQLVYMTNVNGRQIVLSADRVLHIPGLGYDGLQGYNVIQYHRDSLGLSAAASEYGAQFFGNSARPSGYLEHPGNPDPDARRQLREEWNQVHSGLSAAQRTAVLWGGMKWTAVSVPPNDAQFLQTREMQIDEVARILNIHPILLQHFTKVTTWGSGVAEFLINYVQQTITPWIVREEERLNRALFRPEEQGRYFVKFNVTAWLRGDPEARARVLEIERRNGIRSADEWRALLDENPLPGGQGTLYMVPMNMMNAELLAAPIVSSDDEPERPVPGRVRALPERRAVDVRESLRLADMRMFEDGARRYHRREIAAATSAVKKAFASGSDPLDALNRWIDEFYPGHRRVILQTMLPIVLALAEKVALEAASEVGATLSRDDIAGFADGFTEGLITREMSSSIGQIKDLMAELEEDELEDALLTRFGEWGETRAGKVAADESVRTASSAARFAWIAVGVPMLTWQANRDACPLCSELNGRSVPSTGYFARAGDMIGDVGGETTPLVAKHNIATPPLHQGCNCHLVPGG